MKKLNSYKGFLVEQATVTKKPSEQVWNAIVAALGLKAHLKSSSRLAWGEQAKKGGETFNLGFGISKESDRIVIWQDDKDYKKIEDKINDLGFKKVKGGLGSGFTIVEYPVDKAQSVIDFANFMIDDMKIQNPKDVVAGTGDKPQVVKKKEEQKPTVPTESTWSSLTNALKGVGNSKLIPNRALVWGEHLKKKDERDKNGFGITLSKDAGKIFINADKMKYNEIIGLLKEYPSLKVVKYEVPTTGIYGSGGSLVIQFGDDSETPTNFIKSIYEDEEGETEFNRGHG